MATDTADADAPALRFAAQFADAAEAHAVLCRIDAHNRSRRRTVRPAADCWSKAAAGLYDWTAERSARALAPLFAEVAEAEAKARAEFQAEAGAPPREGYYVTADGARGYRRKF